LGESRQGASSFFCLKEREQEPLGLLRDSGLWHEASESEAKRNNENQTGRGLTMRLTTLF
jgi:hypothetical protein